MCMRVCVYIYPIQYFSINMQNTFAPLNRKTTIMTTTIYKDCNEINETKRIVISLVRKKEVFLSSFFVLVFLFSVWPTRKKQE